MPDLDTDRVRALARRLRVAPDTRVRLPHGFDTGDTDGYEEQDGYAAGDSS